MHSPDIPSTPGPDPSPTTGKWWKELNRYHWFVFVVAALGWLADCMDQQLFVLARNQAVTELVTTEAYRQEVARAAEAGDKATLDRLKKERDSSVTRYATLSTALFLIGWAIGGLTFGVLGDKWGRVKTMLSTILVYSVFTGLSAMSREE